MFRSVEIVDNIRCISWGDADEYQEERGKHYCFTDNDCTICHRICSTIVHLHIHDEAPKPVKSVESRGNTSAAEITIFPTTGSTGSLSGAKLKIVIIDSSNTI